MRGFHVGMGLLFFFGGLAVTLVSMSSGRGGIIAVGAMGVGVVQFLYGLSLGSGRDDELSGDGVLAGTSVGYQTLVQTTIAAAELDGPLDAGRIARVQAVLRRMSSEEVTADFVRAVSQSMRKKGVAPTARLVTMHSHLTPPVCQAVLAAAALVLASPQGALTAKQREFVVYIGRALQYRDGEIGAIIDNALQPPAPAPAVPEQPQAATPAATLSYGGSSYTVNWTPPKQT
jgi:hypothetical protein